MSKSAKTLRDRLDHLWTYGVTEEEREIIEGVDV